MVYLDMCQIFVSRPETEYLSRIVAVHRSNRKLGHTFFLKRRFRNLYIL